MSSDAARNGRVLLLEPDPGHRRAVTRTLTDAGYRVTPAADVTDALAVLARGMQDAAVVSLPAGAEAGSQALAQIRRRGGELPVLLMVDRARVREAVRNLRDGAADYLHRPADPLELCARLERILERQDVDSRIAFLQDQLSKKNVVRRPEARSTAMARVLEKVQRVSPMRSTVLISGESGVGKELVARMIHFNSPRRDKPFIALNCAAIPTTLIDSELFGHEKGAFTGAYTRSRGKFEIADEGTLFLDEIGEMELASQAKLLRVLEQREFMRIGGDRSIRVDVRLIAATNAELETLVRQGGLRRDLYYRLKVVTITVPPLRERAEDLPALVETFLDELSRINGVPRKRISPEALTALQAYHWPGNVRELKNLVESLLVSLPGERIELEHLPAAVRRDRSGSRRGGLVPGMTIEDMERELIRVTLSHTGGNRTHSAEILGIGVRTLQRKIRAYGIEIAPRRRRSRGSTEGPGAKG